MTADITLTLTDADGFTTVSYRTHDPSAASAFLAQYDRHDDRQTVTVAIAVADKASAYRALSALGFADGFAQP